MRKKKSRFFVICCFVTKENLSNLNKKNLCSMLRLAAAAKFRFLWVLLYKNLSFVEFSVIFGFCFCSTCLTLFPESNFWDFSFCLTFVFSGSSTGSGFVSFVLLLSFCSYFHHSVFFKKTKRPVKGHLDDVHLNIQCILNVAAALTLFLSSAF